MPGFFEELQAENEENRQRLAVLDNIIELYGGAKLDSVLPTPSDSLRLDAWGIPKPYSGDVAIADDTMTLFYWRGRWPNIHHKVPLIVAEVKPVPEDTIEQQSLRSATWMHGIIDVNFLRTVNPGQAVWDVVSAVAPTELDETLRTLEKQFPPNYALLKASCDGLSIDF